MRDEEIEFCHAKLVLAKRDLQAVKDQFRPPTGLMGEFSINIYLAVDDALRDISRAIVMIRPRHEGDIL